MTGMSGIAHSGTNSTKERTGGIHNLGRELANRFPLWTTVRGKSKKGAWTRTHRTVDAVVMKGGINQSIALHRRTKIGVPDSGRITGNVCVKRDPL